MRYLYDGHLGSLFTSDNILSYEECYCETCGDSDQLIGTFTTLEEFWNLIKDDCDIDGSEGWCLQYIFPLIVSEFELPVELTYDDYDMKSQGFCNFTDKEIIELIEKYKNENTKSN